MRQFLTKRNVYILIILTTLAVLVVAGLLLLNRSAPINDLSSNEPTESTIEKTKSNLKPRFASAFNYSVSEVYVDCPSMVGDVEIYRTSTYSEEVPVSYNGVTINQSTFKIDQLKLKEIFPDSSNQSGRDEFESLLSGNDENQNYGTISTTLLNTGCGGAAYFPIDNFNVTIPNVDKARVYIFIGGLQGPPFTHTTTPITIVIYAKSGNTYLQYERISVASDIFQNYSEDICSNSDNFIVDCLMKNYYQSEVNKYYTKRSVENLVNTFAFEGIEMKYNLVGSQLGSQILINEKQVILEFSDLVDYKIKQSDIFTMMLENEDSRITFRTKPELFGYMSYKQIISTKVNDTNLFRIKDEESIKKVSDTDKFPYTYFYSKDYEYDPECTSKALCYAPEIIFDNVEVICQSKEESGQISCDDIIKQAKFN